MSSRFKHYHSGDIYGIIYHFENAGDGIKMHMHLEECEHNITVLTGAILLYGPDGEDKIKLVAGQIYDFDSTLPHEIVALEPRTSLINTFLHGIPEGYDSLPDSELEGILDLKLTHRIHDFANPVPVLEH